MKTINVSVSVLKSKLSEYLRMVKRGTNIVVLDHKHPIAKIAPTDQAESLDFVSIKPSESSLKDIFPVRKRARAFSSLEILLEDRKKR